MVQPGSMNISAAAIVPCTPRYTWILQAGVPSLGMKKTRMVMTSSRMPMIQRIMTEGANMNPTAAEAKMAKKQATWNALFSRLDVMVWDITLLYFLSGVRARGMAKGGDKHEEPYYHLCCCCAVTTQCRRAMRSS